MAAEYVKKRRLFKLKPTKLNRSRAGNSLLFGLMIICGLFMVLPLVMIINNALKPLDELFQYPPKIFVRNPTLESFSDLFVLMNDTWVPFSRYILNTIIITLGGTVGHVLVASLAAYPLAKHDFPGKKNLPAEIQFRHEAFQPGKSRIPPPAAHLPKASAPDRS